MSPAPRGLHIVTTPPTPLKTGLKSATTPWTPSIPPITVSYHQVKKPRDGTVDTIDINTFTVFQLVLVVVAVWMEAFSKRNLVLPQDGQPRERRQRAPKNLPKVEKHDLNMRYNMHSNYFLHHGPISPMICGAQGEDVGPGP